MLSNTPASHAWDLNTNTFLQYKLCDMQHRPLKHEQKRGITQEPAVAVTFPCRNACKLRRGLGGTGGGGPLSVPRPNGLGRVANPVFEGGGGDDTTVDGKTVVCWVVVVVVSGVGRVCWTTHNTTNTCKMLGYYHYYNHSKQSKGKRKTFVQTNQHF
jgi:hypothetical protein